MSSEKKLSMQELVKQQLERKKQAQANVNNTTNSNNKNQRMKSQQTKKPSGMPRKIGG